MNAQGEQNMDQNPGSGGPVVAIVLGAIIIIGAVVLVWNVGKGEVTETTEEKTAETSAAATGEKTPAKTEDAAKPAETAPVATVKEGAVPAEIQAKVTDALKVEGAIKTGNEVLDRAKAYAELKMMPEGDIVAVQVELPNPAFAGTPKEAPKGVKMRKLTGKDRGPYVLPKSIADSLKNLAADKEVTSSDSLPLIGDLEQVTDGDKEPLDGRWVELAPGVQWVQVDLGKETENFAIFVWHNHMETALVYRDVVVQVSNDPEFVEGVTTVFNNDWDNSAGFGVGTDFEYFENYEGLLIPLYDPITGQGMKFRYVRAYSNGSTNAQANHYTEIEVHGRETE